MNYRITTALAILAVALGARPLDAQTYRVEAMGGASLAIDDETLSLTPYDFDGNPAWMARDETKTRLDVVPSGGYVSGDYRRRYSAEAIDIYHAKFDGVKNLDSSGVFRGSADYVYETRQMYERSLKRNPYAGEAFFYADTTAGEFRYNGPDARATYAFEPIDGLTLGVFGGYMLLDGLKRVYTYAEVVDREVVGVFGAAYEPTPGLVIGATVELEDESEKIAANDVNLREVETYYYRGETYRVSDRGSTSEQRIRKSRFEPRGQIYWRPLEGLELAAAGGPSYGSTIVEAPTGLIIEYEEGYASFDGYEAKAAAKWRAFDNVTAGARVRYEQAASWSKISDRDLLIWEWETDALGVEAGVAYEGEGFLATIEAGATARNADSTKYIDRRFVSLSSTDFRFLAAGEFAVSEIAVARAGVGYATLEHDYLYGGEDATAIRGSLGAEFDVGGADLSFTAHFDRRESGGETRDRVGAAIALRLWTF
jgi:hypothetical protein